MPQTAELLTTLATELERPRPLPAQVTRHLCGVHGVERDEIAHFLQHGLAALEDYEIDLALAPVFTPTLDDQAVIADLLEGESIPQNDWANLVRALVDRPTEARLVTEDGQSTLVPLRDVSIERYVHRLRLNGGIPPAFVAFINTETPSTLRPLLKAIARRAIWENESRGEILRRYLEKHPESSATLREDAIELLKVMETYEPTDVTDLLGRIPQWEKILKHEVSLASGSKPFFNERVQDLHGGGRDQRLQESVQPKQRELEFLGRLKQALSEG